MLTADPLSILCVVIKVDLADVMQQTTDEGDSGAQGADLVLQAVGGGSRGDLMAVFK